MDPVAGPEAVEEKNILAPARNRTPVVQTVTIPTELSGLI
jgi:hypothetical protein